jgi:hypothetical protein
LARLIPPTPRKYRNCSSFVCPKLMQTSSTQYRIGRPRTNFEARPASSAGQRRRRQIKTAPASNRPRTAAADGDPEDDAWSRREALIRAQLDRHEHRRDSELTRAVAYRGGVDFASLPPALRALQQSYDNLRGARAGNFRAADLFSSSLSRAMLDLQDSDCPTPPWFESLFLMQAEAFRRLTASRNAYAERVDEDFEARVARAVDTRVYAKITELAASIEAESATTTADVDDKEADLNNLGDSINAPHEGKKTAESHSRHYKNLTVRAIARLRRIASAQGLARSKSEHRRHLDERFAEEEAFERDGDASNLTQDERRMYIRGLGEGGRSVEVLRELERDILSTMPPPPVD